MPFESFMIEVVERTDGWVLVVIVLIYVISHYVAEFKKYRHIAEAVTGAQESAQMVERIAEKALDTLSRDMRELTARFDRFVK